MVKNAKIILVVDQEESTRDQLRDILEDAQYKVSTAGNGQKALEKANAIRFDAVLTDIQLPDMEGTELLKQLPKKRETVKIVMTGSSNPDVGAKAADCGADEYLLKPVQPQELLETLSKLLEEI